jgi:hypothetical protein
MHLAETMGIEYGIHKGLRLEELPVFVEKNVALSYNQTEGLLLDLYESFLQWSRDANVAGPDKCFWRTLLTGSVSCEAWSGFVSSVQGVGWEIPSERITVADLGRHIATYRQAISAGRKVLIVAHSQGNYFANEAYKSTEVLPSERESLGVVALASPASYVAGNGPHLTLWEDPIHFVVPGSLPFNETNGALIPRWDYHDFELSYLLGSPSGSKIMSLIDETLAVLKEPSRQPIVRLLFQGQPGQPGKDIWTTNIYSYAPGGLEPGGGLDNEELVVGGWGDSYYSLLQFDLTGLPEHASSARVELFCYRTRGVATTSLYLDRIVQPWDWRTQGSGRDRDRLWWFDRPAGEQWRPDSLPAPTVGEWYSIDVTDMYNLWQGGYPNYGLQLRPTSIGNEWSEFYSSNYSDPAFRPRLVVVP